MVGSGWVTSLRTINWTKHQSKAKSMALMWVFVIILIIFSKENVYFMTIFWFSQSTIKFNVDLKGCQIGWSGYLYKEDNLTSDLSCSFDLDRIPYEFAVTKNTKTNHVEATFKFAGMHSSRLVILASTYLPPNTQFAKLLKKAVRILYSLQMIKTFNNNQINFLFQFQMDQDMKFRESMGDVFASITQQGQAHVNKALPMVDFPENL